MNFDVATTCWSHIRRSAWVKTLHLTATNQESQKRLHTDLQHRRCERGGGEGGAAEAHGREVRGGDQQGWRIDLQDFGRLPRLPWALRAECVPGRRAAFSLHWTGFVPWCILDALHLHLLDIKEIAASCLLLRHALHTVEFYVAAGGGKLETRYIWVDCVTEMIT